MPIKYKVFFSGVSEDMNIYKTQIFLTSERICCQVTKIKNIQRYNAKQSKGSAIWMIKSKCLGEIQSFNLASECKNDLINPDWGTVQSTWDKEDSLF